MASIIRHTCYRNSGLATNADLPPVVFQEPKKTNILGLVGLGLAIGEAGPLPARTSFRPSIRYSLRGIYPGQDRLDGR